MPLPRGIPNTCENEGAERATFQLQFIQCPMAPWRRFMITFEITADVKDDRRVVLTLPPEVPTGQARLVVTVNSPPSDNKRPRTSLADWADANAENWGDRLSSE